MCGKSRWNQYGKKLFIWQFKSKHEYCFAVLLDVKVQLHHWQIILLSFNIEPFQIALCDDIIILLLQYNRRAAIINRSLPTSLDISFLIYFIRRYSQKLSVCEASQCWSDTLKLYVLLKTKLNEHALISACCSRQFTKVGSEKPAGQQGKCVGGKR